MNKVNCSVCKFWKSLYDYRGIHDYEEEFTKSQIKEFKTIGMCRRYPPVPLEHDADVGFSGFDGNATDFFEFVHVYDSDWCGEFVNKSIKQK